MKYVRDGRRLVVPSITSERQRFVRELSAPSGRVVALLAGAVRQMMDAAIGDPTSMVHVDSVSEALSLVRQTPASVLLVSPEILRHGETALLSKALSTTAHAVVVLNGEPRDPTLLLQLGACGLRRAIDLRDCQGWHDLRQLLSDGSDPLAGRIAAIVLHHLDGAAPGTKRFFARMVYEARWIRTVSALADCIGIVPSTLMSRFYRARLPTPKTLLSTTRLMLAKALLEESQVSVSAVANGLRYSSPQAFGRHVWRMLRMSAGEFRRRVTFAQIEELYVEQLIDRHRATYRTFDPFASFGGLHATAPEEVQPSYPYH